MNKLGFILVIFFIVSILSVNIQKDSKKSVSYRKLKSLGAGEEILSSFQVLNNAILMNFEIINEIRQNVDKYEQYNLILNQNLIEYNEKARNYVLHYTPAEEGNIREIIIESIHKLDKVENDLKDTIFILFSNNKFPKYEINFLSNPEEIPLFPKKDYPKISFAYPEESDFTQTNEYQFLKHLKASDDILTASSFAFTAIKTVERAKNFALNKLDFEDKINKWNFEKFYNYARKATNYLLTKLKGVENSNKQLTNTVLSIVYKLDEAVEDLKVFEKNHERIIFHKKTAPSMNFSLPKDLVDIPDAPFRNYKRKNETSNDILQKLKKEYSSDDKYITIKYALDYTDEAFTLMDSIYLMLTTTIKSDFVNADKINEYTDRLINYIKQINDDNLDLLIEVILEKREEFNSAIEQHNKTIKDYTDVSALSLPKGTLFIPDSPKDNEINIPKILSQSELQQPLLKLRETNASQEILQAYSYIIEAHVLLNALVKATTDSTNSGSKWKFDNFLNFANRANEYFSYCIANSNKSTISEKVVEDLSIRIDELKKYEEKHNSICKTCMEVIKFSLPEVSKIPQINKKPESDSYDINRFAELSVNLNNRLIKEDFSILIQGYAILETIKVNISSEVESRIKADEFFNYAENALEYFKSNIDEYGLSNTEKAQINEIIKIYNNNQALTTNLINQHNSNCKNCNTISQFKLPSSVNKIPERRKNNPNPNPNPNPKPLPEPTKPEPAPIKPNNQNTDNNQEIEDNSEYFSTDYVRILLEKYKDQQSIDKKNAYNRLKAFSNIYLEYFPKYQANPKGHSGYENMLNKSMKEFKDALKILLN